MADSVPMISATSLVGLEDFLLKTYQEPLEPLLAEVGICARPPYDKAPRFELKRFAELFEQLAVRTKEPCFGLAFARVFPRGAGGVLGYLIMNAPNLRAFMHCLRRYTRLQMDSLELDYTEADGLLHITWGFGSDFISPRKQLTEFLLSLFVVRTLQFFGDDLKPMAVEFDYREPPCRADYLKLFGPNLKFGSTRNMMTMRADFLSRVAIKSDERLFMLLENVAEEHLKQLGGSDDIVAKLGREIVARLPMDGVELEEVAKALGMSSRRLQSQLKRSGTSFEAEMGRIRMGLAERYLRDTNFSMTDIALLLGFSELSSFTRAARSWFAKPPSAVREEARKGEPSGK